MNDMYDVLVVGGGAAGMMASIAASENGKSVCLAEQNEKLGKKLFITGKGRCNLTNACPEDEIFEHIVTNSRSMYSSIKRFSNRDVMDFFTERGLKIKTERGDRVFPASDHSSDVIKTLERAMNDLGVNILLNTKVKKLCIDCDTCTGVILANGKMISANRVIIATGGMSYTSTGSTGDGYRFAKEAGIEVTKRYPSLVPLNIRGDICPALQGLSLKNAGVTVKLDDKTVYNGFGEMLFTHFGVSGPLILTASSVIDPASYGKDLKLHIDLKPAMSAKELDQRVLRDFSDFNNREFKNSLGKLLPAKLIPVIIKLSGTDPYKKVNSISRKERLKLVGLLKDMCFDIVSTRGFDEAIITKGGISMKEIDPKTFEAKKIKNLFFAGEVLDVDAHTGGFNLQIAWSSGHASGTA